jgi:hypothetical protein
MQEVCVLRIGVIGDSQAENQTYTAIAVPSLACSTCRYRSVDAINKLSMGTLGVSKTQPLLSCRLIFLTLVALQIGSRAFGVQSRKNNTGV